MHILPRPRSSPARSQLRTDYRVTDGYCLELYYIIRGSAVLSVKTRGEDYLERNIASATIASKVMLLLFVLDLHK